MSDEKHEFIHESRRAIVVNALFWGFASFLFAWTITDSVQSFSFTVVFLASFLVGMAAILQVFELPWFHPIDYETGWGSDWKIESNNRYVVAWALVTVLMLLLVGVVMFTNIFGTDSIGLWYSTGHPHPLLLILSVHILFPLLFLVNNLVQGISRPD